MVIRLSAASRAVGCVILFLAGSAQARNMTPAEAQQVPGSWSGTCQGVFFRGTTLVADCPVAQGFWHSSARREVELLTCDTSIETTKPDHVFPVELVCAESAEAGDPEKKFLAPELVRKIPGGWANNCKGLRLEGSVLHAVCAVNANKGGTSSIDLNTCNTSIENIEGQLTCAASAEVAAPAQDQFLTREQMQQIPGPWSGSCRNAQVKGRELVAECSDTDGNWVSSALNVDSCNTAAENQNGRLTCAAPVEVARPAPGSEYQRLTPEEMQDIPGPWSESCQNAVVDLGRSIMMAECPDPDGALLKSAIDLGACGSGASVVNDGGSLVCR